MSHELDAEAAIRALVDLDHPVKVEVAEWATTHLAGGDRVARDRDSVFAADDWQRCADRGLLGMLVPKEYGGTERTLIDALLMLEGLGKGCRDNGLSFALASQVVSTQTAIERFGSDDQKRRWLPGLCDGSFLGAFAITEPDAGSDTNEMSTVAEPLPDGSYRLTGEKAWITLGSRFDVVVTFAATNPEAGRWGISAFVVDAATPGVEALGNREKMGMRTTPFGNIRFDGAVVPASSRLGREGAGKSIFTAAMEAERALVYATQVGAMERELDDALAFAHARTQSGHPIVEYQAVSHRLADMKLRHETARLFLYKAACTVLAGRPATLAAALAKLAASEAAVASSLDAARIFGAQGYVSEFEVERGVRDAVGGLVYSGTSDIQRNIVARLLGTRKKA